MKRRKGKNRELPATDAENHDDPKKGLTRREFVSTTVAAVPALILPGLIGNPAEASVPQATCPLTEPKVLASTGPSVNSALVMRMQSWAQDGCKLKLVPPGTPGAMQLRTYGSPKDPNQWNNKAYLSNDANLDWAIPGPTFKVKQGQRLNINLYNRLPVEADDHACNPNAPPGSNPDTYPDCFHGSNTTNIHYHGSHVSPNRPQDWVFLELKPEGSPPNPHDSSNTVIGWYESRVGPFPKTQAVGTQFYHPHKHGSVSIQVTNGMAGCFIVEGYFDDYLRQQIPGLREHVLAVMQISDKLNFFVNPAQAPGPAPPRVNGILNPVIEMYPGEIQRWRLIGESVQALGPFVIGFDGPNAPVMRQIAQDGVPFAPENYRRQVLNLAKPNSIDLLGARKSLLGAVAAAPDQFQLGPGNRMDFLVQAPRQTGEHRLLHQSIGAAQQRPNLRAAAPAPLFTVRVVPGPTRPVSFPQTLPPLPWPFSPDISNAEIGDRNKKTVAFSMTPAAANNPAQLFIDTQKYKPDRIDQQVYLNLAEQWLVTNSSGIAHPFHIHINPFQITAINGSPLPQPWVWWDTFPIPVQQQSGAVGSVTIRQRFIEYTGEYVLHCHILGHEDRGMMQNVRCSPTPPGRSTRRK
jgi:FtsP/CotA-like multicopper oxidase with cupredoxin domain